MFASPFFALFVFSKCFCQRTALEQRLFCSLSFCRALLAAFPAAAPSRLLPSEIRQTVLQHVFVAITRVGRGKRQKSWQKRDSFFSQMAKKYVHFYPQFPHVPFTLGETPTLTNAYTLISEATEVYNVSGPRPQLLLKYCTNPHAIETIREADVDALLQIPSVAPKLKRHQAGAGTVQQTYTFGMTFNRFRQETYKTTWNIRHPELSTICQQIVESAWKELQQLVPCQCSNMSRVKEALGLEEIRKTGFSASSFNINFTCAFHVDKGDYLGMAPIVYFMKGQQTGGLLLLPQLGLAIECRNRSIVFLPSKVLVHGVTELDLIEPGSY